MIYTKLHACRLSRESHLKTCGYWYVVTTGAMSHTAFRTRRGLDKWLGELGLSLADSAKLNEPGTGGTAIIGAYRREYTKLDRPAFEAMDGVRVIVYENGSPALGIITNDDDGIRTLHVTNPNNDRAVFTAGEYETANHAKWNDPDPHSTLTL